jgi:hypothetical protein
MQRHGCYAYFVAVCWFFSVTVIIVVAAAL